MDIFNDSGYGRDENEPLAPLIPRHAFQPMPPLRPLSLEQETLLAINPDDSMFGGIEMSMQQWFTAYERQERQRDFTLGRNNPFENDWFIQPSEEVTDCFLAECAPHDNRVFKALFPVVYPSVQMDTTRNALVSTVPVLRGKPCRAKPKKWYYKAFDCLVEIVARMIGE